MPSSKEAQLRPLRDKIDVIDKQIHECLQKRAALARDIAKVKEAHANGDVNYHCPEREEAVLEKIAALPSGAMPEAMLLEIFQHILKSCRRIQENKR
ncbi:MAG: chorismate mutase [Gammaproteobacteria bacterium]